MKKRSVGYVDDCNGLNKRGSQNKASLITLKAGEKLDHEYAKNALFDHTNNLLNAPIVASQSRCYLSQTVLKRCGGVSRFFMTPSRSKSHSHGIFSSTYTFLFRCGKWQQQSNSTHLKKFPLRTKRSCMILLIEKAELSGHMRYLGSLR